MRLIFFILFLSISSVIWAQIPPTNDDCLSAISIQDTDNFCSSEMEFSNSEATSDPSNAAALAQCVSFNFTNGVWFTFRPSQPAILISINGQIPSGTIGQPRAILYTGSCTAGLNYVSCAPGGLDNLEFTIPDLTVGARYYLYIETNIGEEGTFQLCMDDFVAPPTPESDCPEGVVLCDKSSFFVEALTGQGNLTNELSSFTDRCISAESSSAWYRWTCEDSGTLEFTLTPNNNFVVDRNFPGDDLDFAVFELPLGINDCSGKEMLGCMASGQSQNCDVALWIPNCHGPTGLRASSTDNEETPGCSRCTGGDDDNFIAPLDMISGRSYALVVNNFSNTGQGFSIELGGTGTFRGPQPDFNPEVTGVFIECEKIVMYTDLSDSETDPIDTWNWNFGEGAMPQTISGRGPHEVIYESFGLKTVSLTVESTRGCLVNKLVDVDVLPCCEDFPAIELTAETGRNNCPGEEQGSIEMSADLGTPEYNYSVTEVGTSPQGEFLPNPMVGGLASGFYEVIVQDIRGCEDTTVVEIQQFEPIEVDAGVDLEFDLGSTDVIDATITPSDGNVTFMWSPDLGLLCEGSDSIDCLDPIVGAEFANCLDPSVIVPEFQTFTLTVTDENGCVYTDQVSVTTNIVRPIYEPNIITPTSNDVNSVLRLGFGNQAKRVEEFCIFDRWGNQIYQLTDVELDSNNTMVDGWDGSHGRGSGVSQFVNPGVYIWYAKVRFIDNVEVVFSSDVTVLR